MTKEEFTTRTGIGLSASEFDAIHDAYMATPHDKDAFCKAVTADTLPVLLSIGRTIRMERDLKRATEDAHNKLVDYLFEQSIKTDTEALQAKARELLGCDEYLARLVEAGEPLEDEDLAYIAAKIRRQ